MTILDYILVALVLGAAIYSVLHLKKQKKKGKACCGSCSGCTINCDNHAEKGGL